MSEEDSFSQQMALLKAIEEKQLNTNKPNCSQVKSSRN
jgi:hypothetical protein